MRRSWQAAGCPVGHLSDTGPSTESGTPDTRPEPFNLRTSALPEPVTYTPIDVGTTVVRAGSTGPPGAVPEPARDLE
ncbi:hypothetical protein HLK59_00050 [Streptomyces sp. S3(2020)]|uniref:hypothetical protein n=1 Tax=Streptomyces sp. S3(2020) TaxID=2732044 RepID=UPI0014884474|nr:hypothetical protein [Streptomyces sp. S3(2020)]NNN28765.1 hypothetical protein [Streptomyces sp. S3(2020)]